MSNKMKRATYPVITILIVLVLFFTCSAAVSASSVDFLPQPVADAGNGIVRVILCCADDNGNTYYIHQGTGFLAGTNSESQYIITDNQTITASESELKQIRKWNGLSPDIKLTPQIQFLLYPDIVISANTVSTGTDFPYALLTPSAPMNSLESLKFSSISNISKKQTAYLYGYDQELSILGQTQIPDVSLAARTGAITAVEADPAAISCNIDAAGGNAGSPLLDENGCVLGMFYQNQDTLEVLPADTIRELLKALNITYKTNDPTGSYNVADAEIKQELSDLLAECQKDVTLHASEYSNKTLANYKAAINTAMEIIASPDSTKDNYQECIDALKTARKKLKPHNFTQRIIQLVLLAVLLATALLHLRQLKKFKRFLATLHPEAEIEPEPSSEKPAAALIRTDTNEVMWLEKKELRIGSDSKKVDYCIKDNPAISRYHAAIVYKDSQFYIIDNNSTNRTFVNHSPVEPHSAVVLQDEDSISLANVSFQFRITSSL